MSWKKSKWESHIRQHSAGTEGLNQESCSATAQTCILLQLPLHNSFAGGEKGRNWKLTGLFIWTSAINWILMSPLYVWQLSVYPPPPAPGSFSLLAKQGDLFYWGKRKDWYLDTAVCIQLFVLVFLLYFREIERLALQSELQYKIENKFAVHQVSSKKEMRGIYCTLLLVNMHPGSY